MGTNYQKSFTPYLELFEPRSVYISELRLQHAWKNTLWKVPRRDALGRDIRILSPGRHNHSDGPDFIDARIMLNGKLLSGDIELHRRASEWYNHKHHLDKGYDKCILHIIFQSTGRIPETKCSSGRVLPVCNIPLKEVLEMEPGSTCRIFRPDKKEYFRLLEKQGWERVNKKVKYFYNNRLRFPSDVMLYWGLFKACGYRYNEENMIKLFVRFPWAAYCDGLLDQQDIIPMMWDLAGFSNMPSGIRWTRSRTRPAHFPEKRVAWLGKLITHYYRSSLSDIILETYREKENIFKIISGLFAFPEARPPGESLRKEMILNTILPLLMAMCMEYGNEGSIKQKIKNAINSTYIIQTYGNVKRFHDIHGIGEKDKHQKNWLISQGVLNIRDHHCSQGGQLKCPICLLEDSSQEAEVSSQKTVDRS